MSGISDIYVQRIEGRIVQVFPTPRPDWDPPTDPVPLPAGDPEVLAFLGADSPLRRRLLTPLEFMARLTDDEQAGLHRLQVSVPAVAGWMWGIIASGGVDLDDPPTADVLVLLVGADCMGPERPPIILA